MNSLNVQLDHSADSDQVSTLFNAMLVFTVLKQLSSSMNMLALRVNSQLLVAQLNLVALIALEETTAEKVASPTPIKHFVLPKATSVLLVPLKDQHVQLGKQQLMVLRALHVPLINFVLQVFQLLVAKSDTLR